jgi:putative spermidine/putrescine transport system substrate-binding protein
MQMIASRRSLFAAAAFVALGLGTTVTSDARGDFVVNSYGGSFEEFMREQIVPPFEEMVGQSITLDVNLGKGWLTNLRAAGVDNAPYDVLMTNETWASIERQEGFFEPIDASKVPNMKDLWSIARMPDDSGVIGTLSPIGIAYRTDLVENPPTSWADLWTNPEFKGRTGLYTITNSAGYMTLLMTAKIFHGSEYETDKALEKIKELSPFQQIDFSGTMETVLTRGEVIVGPLDFAAAARLKTKGVPVEIVAPEEGMFMFEQVFNVLKASDDKDLGHQWINYILSPEVQEKWVRNYYWSPVNKNVSVPEELADLVPIHGERMNEIVTWDWKTANEKRDQVIEAWNKTIR